MYVCACVFVFVRVFMRDSLPQHVSCLINHFLGPTEAALSHPLILVDIKRAPSVWFIINASLIPFN